MGTVDERAGGVANAWMRALLVGRDPGEVRVRGGALEAWRLMSYGLRRRLAEEWTAERLTGPLYDVGLVERRELVEDLAAGDGPLWPALAAAFVADVWREAGATGAASTPNPPRWWPGVQVSGGAAVVFEPIDPELPRITVVLEWATDGCEVGSFGGLPVGDLRLVR